MEIAKLSNTEFKTLVIRMLKELIKYGNNIKEEMVMLSGIRKNLQGTNSEGEEARIQINDLEHKEKISIQLEQQEETRTQKNKDSIRSLWDISKCANIQIIGVPEGEEEEQDIENLFEKIMTENCPNLAKDIDIRVQEAQSHKQDECRGPSKTHHD